ncbi:MAG: nuclear transport factor 2 family protein [Anaerolineae bacterium]|nr:nuclear transport factor 2 family protein [Anaerolineae bacterium]MBL8104933.1 nuclear transport factor 2 family protein [Anaerolineales bacterium]MCC7189435.1 nuclear transport factor 2 family protein [Anaerolineales bacterium]
MTNNNESSETSQQKQRVSGLFDRVANTFDHVGPRFFSHFGRRLVELAHIPSGAHVLDVATGRGAALFHREDGEWRIVRHHVSIAIPNAELLAKYGM